MNQQSLHDARTLTPGKGNLTDSGNATPINAKQTHGEHTGTPHFNRPAFKDKVLVFPSSQAQLGIGIQNNYGIDSSGADDKGTEGNKACTPDNNEHNYNNIIEIHKENSIHDVDQEMLQPLLHSEMKLRPKVEAVLHKPVLQCVSPGDPPDSVPSTSDNQRVVSKATNRRGNDKNKGESGWVVETKSLTRNVEKTFKTRKGNETVLHEQGSNYSDIQEELLILETVSGYHDSKSGSNKRNCSLVQVRSR